jgi:hypothetical protein
MCSRQLPLQVFPCPEWRAGRPWRSVFASFNPGPHFRVRAFAGVSVHWTLTNSPSLSLS